MNNYFIILNAEVVAACKRWSKAKKLFDYYKTKVNTNADILQLYEKGYGIINEF